MRPDFNACGKEFLEHAKDRYVHYVYNGTNRAALDGGQPTLITVEGCRKLCGTGTQYYEWKDAANTITTWVLPIIGLIIQAPWESNEAWETTLAFFRYMGSPISVLSYVLWNIKVTGKAALMVDMAVKYNEYPPEGSDFSSMRDSMYILCIMNQYSIKQSLPPIESEWLLRIALFDNTLQFGGSVEARDNIVARRTELARALREGRKKGVIPVFISFFWFVFALALSIELAYDNIGGNQTAHNLAMGLLVGWLPVMVVGSTVDRNSVSADSVRERLNSLVNEVRDALLDSNTFQRYKMATNSSEEDLAWIETLRESDMFDDNFFVAFGGQGRTHFHYGVAHPILSGIETKFMAEYGRDWLRHSATAREAIMVGSRNVNGLKMFDLRMAWQVGSAAVIFCGATFGSFFISWFTPTVGLGCRTGGYLIHIVLALALLSIEVGVWFLTHDTTHTSHDLMRRVSTRLERRFTDPEKGLQHDSRTHRLIMYLHSRAFRDVVKVLVIRPLEAFNTGWLIYIIFAQTFGTYQTCACKASNWAKGKGGFIDLQYSDFYNGHSVYMYWSVGVALSCTVMTGGLWYIAHEYCTQGHMSTEHYERAMHGLKWTRWYKKHTRFVRFLPNRVLGFGKWLGFAFTRGRTRRIRRSLVWTVYEKPKPSLGEPQADRGP
ncbi:MAG: hypothetical protein Q9167_006626 [Letrouitia subvulpina]